MADISAVKEITSKLEKGIKELFESEKYAEYLQTMSRFHNYSTRNTLLIHQQMPTATKVAGYTSWNNYFKRQVKKGEKGIKIFAPIPFIQKKEMEKIDPVTQRPIIGEDGQSIKDEIEIITARFKVVSVFDISQTEGEPLPVLVETLTGDVARYELFMDVLKAVSPLPVTFENLPPDTDGVCKFGDKISIRNNMSEAQTVSAVIHEITHAKLHDLQALSENNAPPKDRRTEEVEAESVSYAVCQYYGIDTGANSFGYLAEWSKTRELKELNASLDTIRKTAAEMIDSIDEQYRALAKERGIDLTVTAEQPAVNVAPNNEIPDYSAIPTENRTVGANVLMKPLFIDGNFNRAGKKIRITVEEPIGKYQLFSRNEFDVKNLYFLTASGYIDRTQEYFRNEWSHETHKWENHIPTEAELDEVIPKIARQFESDMADPTRWAKYQHAAVLNRIADCEAHNVPVRKLRDEESKLRHEAAEQKRREEQQRQEEKYNGRIDEIAESIRAGKSIDVTYNEYVFGKNPVLDLFKLYGIDLPLRTQGWVNSGLAEIKDGSYSYYKSKHKGNSSTFSGYLTKLTKLIKETPIEALRRQNQPAAETEVKGNLENKLYEKLSELFPDFMNRKYRYMRLESEGRGTGSAFEPLSLEWIFGNRISIMHTYTMNGDLMYDPMMEFIVSDENKTLTASSFEQSMPPIYQYIDENGIGRITDGNGNAHKVQNLQEKLNDFTLTWFENIGEQGFIPVKADLVLGEDNEVRVTFDKDGNMVMPEPEKPEVSEPDISLPDPTVTADEMNAYGYTETDMYPLSCDKAVELFNDDLPIYLLYPDNSEALALDSDEIITFSSGGFCGITKADWEVSHMFAEMKNELANAEGSREAELLYGNEDKFGIYQVKDGTDETRNALFTPISELEAHGLSVDRANYELVYVGKLDVLDTQMSLDRIFADFQGENPWRPAEYTARSVSVSDVIVLQKNGEVSAHFVDSIDFKELTTFTGNEREQTALQNENSYSQLGNSSPSLAELEADVKAGKSISLMDMARAVKAEKQPPKAKGKPSLLDKLEQNKQRASRQEQLPHKSDELEV